MFEFLGSAVSPAITQGATDTALNTGIDQALAGTAVNSLGQSTAGLGLDGAFQTLGNVAQVGPQVGNLAPTMGNAVNIAGQPSMFETIGNYAGQAGDFLTGDQGKNMFDTIGKGYNLYNQNQALQGAQDIQGKQLAQSEDRYAREKKADEKRQKLVF